LSDIILEKDHPSTSSLWFKKHRYGIGFLFIVVASIGCVLYLTLSWMLDEHRLPLSKIVLQGDLRYVSAHDVQIAFANLDHIGTFMSQDIDELQRAVQVIPWIDHASIRKQWPDTIKVFLTEHHAKAIWNGISLLDDQANIFNGDVGLLDGEYVKLYGPDDSALEVMNAWEKYNPKFKQLGMQITSLVLNERRAWQIILDNGIRLELGKESIEERIARFISLYTYFGSKAEKISYIDLRYDTGAAVGWFTDQTEQEKKHD
jgi:cell division protein FtsQ